MASKPKGNRTFIVIHMRSNGKGGSRPYGRYRVGAKNEKQAEELVRNLIGKHETVQFYYEVTVEDKLLSFGEIIKEN